MLSVLKLTHILNLGFLEPRNTGATCVRTTLSPAQLRAVLAKIGSTCARTTCVLGALVTGSTWTLEQLVHGQHELQGHLLHGQHEHWVKLLHGTVVQGWVNIASSRRGCMVNGWNYCRTELTSKSGVLAPMIGDYLVNSTMVMPGTHVYQPVRSAWALYLGFITSLKGCMPEV